MAEVSDDAFARIRGVDFQMDIWTIDRWTGEPSTCAPEERDAPAWLTHEELAGLRLADPGPPMLRAASDGIVSG